MKKRILTLIGILAVLAVIAIVSSYLWYWHERTSAGAAKTALFQSPVLKLQQTNKDFTVGLADQASSNYAGAIASYKKALAETQDPTLDATIEYYLAHAYGQSGDFADSIQTFKQIAANNSGWLAMEAYAVQSMEMLYYENPGDQSITTDIFSGPPYDSFGPSSTTTLDVAYRNLSAYVTSIYPLGISEVAVAYWYENDLRNTLDAATTSAQGIADIAIISSSIAKANTDVERVANDPQAGANVPAILSREGLIEGFMAQMGVGDPKAAEQALQQSVQSAVVQKFPAGNEDAFYYAVFLATYYGKQRAADIDTLLAPFKEGNSANIAPAMASTLNAMRSKPDDAAHGWIVDLGRIDPAFQDYLISLGWQSSDFSG